MWREQRSSPSGYLQAEKVLEAEHRETSAETPYATVSIPAARDASRPGRLPARPDIDATHGPGHWRSDTRCASVARPCTRRDRASPPSSTSTEAAADWILARKLVTSG